MNLAVLIQYPLHLYYGEIPVTRLTTIPSISILGRQTHSHYPPLAKPPRPKRSWCTTSTHPTRESAHFNIFHSDLSTSEPTRSVLISSRHHPDDVAWVAVDNRIFCREEARWEMFWYWRQFSILPSDAQTLIHYRFQSDYRLVTHVNTIVQRENHTRCCRQRDIFFYYSNRAYLLLLW